ncbi:MAG TPA: hypothetical protein VF719_01505 [Abditibacteriaceae bacterium]|jgi:hypothetical protein
MPVKVGSTQELRRQFAAAQAGAKTAKSTNPNKFHAVQEMMEHGKADSGHEARWVEKLQQLQSGGYIAKIIVDKRCLKYALDVNETRIAQYEADARFDVLRDFSMPTFDGERLLRAGTVAVLDAKSPPTRKKADYVMKRNLMYALFRIRIVEV